MVIIMIERHLPIQRDHTVLKPRRGILSMKIFMLSLQAFKALLTATKTDEQLSALGELMYQGGPGEVDDELASECAKYGNVTRVLIFEITESTFPAEESVRIFIQFERAEEATKALIDLDGRFFGGRIVRSTFYDQDRFRRKLLCCALAVYFIVFSLI